MQHNSEPVGVPRFGKKAPGFLRIIGVGLQCGVHAGKTFVEQLPGRNAEPFQRRLDQRLAVDGQGNGPAYPLILERVPGHGLAVVVGHVTGGIRELIHDQEAEQG